MPVKVSYFSVVFVGLSVAGKGKSREPQWQRCACSVSRQWKLSVWWCFFDVARMIPAEKAGFTEGLLRFSGEKLGFAGSPAQFSPLEGAHVCC